VLCRFRGANVVFVGEKPLDRLDPRKTQLHGAKPDPTT
jgi:hypothetical protein